MSATAPAPRATAGCAVVVTKPGAAVAFGPLPKTTAEAWARRLRATLTSSAHPEGTRVGVTGYGPGNIPVTDPETIPADTSQVIEQMRDEPAGDGTGRNFPDLHDRLVMARGETEARRLWDAACAQIDHDAEIADHVRRLHKSVENARGAVESAACDLAQLRGRLYDVELAEGADGADLDALLDQAAAALRHARRITRRQTALLEP